MAVVTITVTADQDDPYAAMQTAGSASILVGVGLAAARSLAAALVAARWPAAAGAVGAPGYLAAYNTRRRGQLLGGVLAPVIVLVAVGLGTL